MAKGKFHDKTTIELVYLLYKQIPLALWGEALAGVGVVIALWNVTSHEVLLFWLAALVVLNGVGRQLLVYQFHKYVQKNSLHYQSAIAWLALFTVGAFISGVCWGVAGSALMVKDDMIRQTFTVFVLIGMTAAGNPFYSPFTFVYASFLIPALVPFVIWLMIQGGLFFILGILALIYLGIMFATSLYTQNLLASSLELRFENTDLLQDLSTKRIELEHSFSTLKATLDSTTDGILAIDEKGEAINYNQKFLEMWHIPSSIMLNKISDIKLVHYVSQQLLDPQRFINKIEELYANPDAESFDEIHFEDGRIYERYSKPQLFNGKCIGRVWSFRDVTGRKLLENRLYKQANYDALTQLPNRALVMDRLSQAISYAKRYNTLLAILFLDLDRFKLINDTLGHTYGDKVLKQIADRLSLCVRENDTVSREGGDEFLIILNSLNGEDSVVSIAKKCLATINEAFYIDTVKMNSSASIGISLYPKDGTDTETLVRNADIAMYRAKEIGGNNFQFFTEQLNRNVQRRSTLENELRNALENEELFILYQPIYNLQTRKISGVEALLRWQNPKLGLIMPTDFIPVAEECGLIIPIGEWTLASACRQVKIWQKAGLNDLGLSANISLRQLRQPAFFEQIQTIVKKYHFETRYLSLEITESIAMEDVDKNIMVLNKLKESGIKIVIDDFGTGYSSLNYLKRLPVNTLKIDKSFIEDLPAHQDDAAITSAIIAIAEQLHMSVIAEGVSNAEQLAFLEKQGCDEVQGFYFSKPLTAKECENLLKSGTEVLV